MKRRAFVKNIPQRIQGIHGECFKVAVNHQRIQKIALATGANRRLRRYISTHSEISLYRYQTSALNNA